MGKQEHKWKEIVTSKRASDNPRSLKSLKNPYEPAEDVGESHKYISNQSLYSIEASSEKDIITLLNMQVHITADTTTHSNSESKTVRL